MSRNLNPSSCSLQMSFKQYIYVCIIIAFICPHLSLILIWEVSLQHDCLNYFLQQSCLKNLKHIKTYSLLDNLYFLLFFKDGHLCGVFCCNLYREEDPHILIKNSLPFYVWQKAKQCIRLNCPLHFYARRYNYMRKSLNSKNKIYHRIVLMHLCAMRVSLIIVHLRLVCQGQ